MLRDLFNSYLEKGEQKGKHIVHMPRFRVKLPRGAAERAHTKRDHTSSARTSQMKLLYKIFGCTAGEAGRLQSVAIAAAAHIPGIPLSPTLPLRDR